MNLFFVVKDRYNINKKIENNIYNKNNNISIKIWDNESFENYIKKKDTKCYNCYLKLNKKFGAMIADYIRYCILYFEGGIYMDCKSSIKNTTLQSFIECSQATDGLHLWRWTQKSFDEYLNWFIVCNKNNKIMQKVIDTINNNIINYNPDKWRLYNSKQNVLNFTGPRILTQIIDNNKTLDKLCIHNNINRKKYLRYNVFINNEYHKLYNQPHYSKVKEHLVLTY